MIQFGWRDQIGSDKTLLELAMMLLIEHRHRQAFAPHLTEMHRLRYRVFKERLDWGVTVRGDLEVDQFDEGEPSYLLHVGPEGHVQGCVRLLPTLGPNMLRDVFSELMDGKPVPASPAIWESSRFALDAPNVSGRAALLSPATAEMFAGMIEFGLAKSLIDLVTVTDVRVERILRRAGWPLRRLSEPRQFGPTVAVVGLLEISLEALASVRCAGELSARSFGRPFFRLPHDLGQALPMLAPRPLSGRVDSIGAPGHLS
jgi:acyl homoserine lactone synthase